VPDPMTLLKADHREAKKLLEQLGETEPGAERADVLAQLVEALSLHMMLEEELIYPKAAERLEPQEAEEAEIEHGLAREGLAKLQEMVDVPGFGAAVDMLKGGILHHVHEEETALLPELKGAMERDEWMAIGDAIVEAKEAAGMPVGASASNGKAKASSGGRSKARR
jgi:iron-sulfur cluster repair protein YtfE (RIC family)